MTHETTITPTAAGHLAECTCGWITYSATRRVVAQRAEKHREGK